MKQNEIIQALTILFFLLNDKERECTGSVSSIQDA